jgi:hypothetical protein
MARWWTFDRHSVILALRFAFVNAGNNNDASIAMIAMTRSNSIRVNRR